MYKPIYPLSWLLEKFEPLNNTAKDGVPDWHTPEGKKMLDYVNKKGKEFYMKHPEITARLSEKQINILGKRVFTKAILYYTDNELDNSIALPCQKQLLKAGLPIYNVSLRPMNFGNNIVLNEKRGYLTLFKQILAGLKVIKEDIVFTCDHDVLYHPSHFDYMPLKKDIFYYDFNVWKVRMTDGLAIHYDAWQSNMLCGYRELLIEDYTKRVEWVEKNGWSTKIGFEPGTQKKENKINNYGTEIWWSKYPSLDIKHGKNLTPFSSTRWYPKDFRNGIRSCPNWMTSESVPDWGVIKGRMNEILSFI